MLPLNTWRNRRGWTQEDLAKAAGVSRSTIKAIEAGKRRRVHPRNRVRIAQALSTPEQPVTVADIAEIANGGSRDEANPPADAPRD